MGITEKFLVSPIHDNPSTVKTFISESTITLYSSCKVQGTLVLKQTLATSISDSLLTHLSVAPISENRSKKNNQTDFITRNNPTIHSFFFLWCVNQYILFYSHSQVKTRNLQEIKTQTIIYDIFQNSEFLNFL